MIQAASTKFLYSAVNLSEKQVNIEAELKRLRRRKKTDKERSQALTETSEDDDWEDDDWEDDEPPRDPKHTIWKAGTVGTAVATIGASVYSILSPFGGVISLVAGAVAACISSMVAVRELFLGDIHALKGVQNALRELANELTHENYRLSKQNDALQIKVFCFKEAEQRLKSIINDPNLNVKNLMNLVAENRRILNEQRKLLRQDIVADVMRVVIRADRDESGHLDDDEIKRLVRYMKGLPSFTVNEERLRKAIKKQGRSLNAVLELVNDIGREDIPAKKRIFFITDNALKFREETVTSAPTGEKSTEMKLRKTRTLMPERHKKDKKKAGRSLSPPRSRTPTRASARSAPSQRKKKVENVEGLKAASLGDTELEAVLKKPKSKKKKLVDEDDVSVKSSKSTKSTKKTTMGSGGMDKSTKTSDEVDVIVKSAKSKSKKKATLSSEGVEKGIKNLNE